MNKYKNKLCKHKISIIDQIKGTVVPAIECVEIQAIETKSAYPHHSHLFKQRI